MSEFQNTCTSSSSSQEEELVSNTMTDTTIDEATLALADELELGMGESTTSEQDASKPEDSPSHSDEETVATTEQVVEHVVITEEVDQISPSAPQWTPVNPTPRPTTGGKGIKQAGGHFIGPSESAVPLNNKIDDDEGIEPAQDHETESADGIASSESEEEEQPKTNTPGLSEQESADDGADTSTALDETAPSSDAAVERDTTPSSAQDNQEATSHPRTGGKGPMAAAPLKLETLKTATAESMRKHLANAGLDTKGTKEDLQVRILLFDSGLDLDTYFHRCSILMSTVWNLKQLKDRCVELGVPQADRKTSSKPKLVKHLLLAEHEQGIIIADGDNGPKTSALSSPKKSKAVKAEASETSTPAKMDLKRKHDDSADATDDEGPDTKRAKSDDSGSPHDNGDGTSALRVSIPRPKKAPRKRPAKAKIEISEPHGNINDEATSRAGSSAPATKNPKRKRTRDDEADQDGHITTKRMKKNDSPLLAARASKKAPTSQLVKQAMKEKPTTKPKARLPMPSSVNNVTFGIPDKVASDVLFENQPIPDAVADAAFRILSGRSNDSDAARVFLYRIRLPKFQAYCRKKHDERTDDDKKWLHNQKFWEIYEMKAVCEEIGEGYDDGAFENVTSYEQPFGMTSEDYFRILKDPEGDEYATKEEKEVLRNLSMKRTRLSNVQVADPEFKKLREGRGLRWE